MNQIIVCFSLFLITTLCDNHIHAQSIWPLRLNEVKTVPFSSYSKKLKKYDAFVEVYNDTTKAFNSVEGYYALGTASVLDQVRLNKARDFRTNRIFRFLRHSKTIKGKAYRAYQISLGYDRKKTLRLENDSHIVYLSYQEGNSLTIIDSLSFKMPSADPISFGKYHPDSLEVRDFNVGTPNQPNINVNIDRIQPRKSLSLFVSILGNTASNTGFSKKPGFKVGWSAGIERRRNKPLYFTSKSIGVTQRGYHFNTQEKKETIKGILTRNLEGYHQELGVFIRWEIGSYIYKNTEFYLGISTFWSGIGKQVFSENRIFEPFVGDSINETFDNEIEIIKLDPDLGLSFGVNYNISPILNLRVRYLQSFSVFQQDLATNFSKTIVFKTIEAGITVHINGKPKTYKRLLFN